MSSPLTPGLSVPGKLESLKVNELKEELRRRNLGISGVKAVLVERLRKYIAEENSRSSLEQARTLPADDAETYPRSLTSEFENPHLNSSPPILTSNGSAASGSRSVALAGGDYSAVPRSGGDISSAVSVNEGYVVAKGSADHVSSPAETGPVQARGGVTAEGGTLADATGHNASSSMAEPADAFVAVVTAAVEAPAAVDDEQGTGGEGESMPVESKGEEEPRRQVTNGEGMEIEVKEQSSLVSVEGRGREEQEGDQGMAAADVPALPAADVDTDEAAGGKEEESAMAIGAGEEAEGAAGGQAEVAEGEGDETMGLQLVAPELELTDMEEAEPQEEGQQEVGRKRRAEEATNEDPSSGTKVEGLARASSGGGGEGTKRQRRWNSGSTEADEPPAAGGHVAEAGTSKAKGESPRAPLPSRRPLAGRLEATTRPAPANGGQPGEAPPRVVPPSKEAASPSLRIDNLLRPFTNKQLQALLEKTGKVEKFWLDRIKTHCYATFSSVEEATATRDALYDLQWPELGGKRLTLKFVPTADVEARVNETNGTAPQQQAPMLLPGQGPPAPPLLPQPHQRQQLAQQQRQQGVSSLLPSPLPPGAPPVAIPVTAGSAAVTASSGGAAGSGVGGAGGAGLSASSRQQQQQHAVPKATAPPAHVPPPSSLTAGASVPATSQVKAPAPSLPPPPPPPRRVPEAIPDAAALPTLDDLFRKTTARPEVYFLPLTDEQVRAKLAAVQKILPQRPGAARVV
eukprot:TRINITY_DN13448_c0_g2_i2.p1 TRINITY_DN13448_c0_g2~~TRINITY_DN13448_c0_g2_i2.p1  ORF type:complete len:744 (-),score=213.71 TRINITY_DN13448_c0_g2_i2:299-2530(-)